MPINTLSNFKFTTGKKDLSLCGNLMTNINGYCEGYTKKGFRSSNDNSIFINPQCHSQFLVFAGHLLVAKEEKLLPCLFFQRIKIFIFAARDLLTLCII